MIQDIVLFLVGILVGLMNAIAGGGILIGFPIMMAFGMPALVANATANIVVLPGNLSAVYGYRKYLKRVPKYYLLLLIPSAIGAAMGALILRHTSFNSFQKYIPWLLLFAAILFSFQPYLYALLHKHLAWTNKGKHSSLKALLIVGLIVLPLSIYGGYFGAGLGFIMLAFLGFTKLHNHIHRMNALKCTITVCIALISIICLFSAHLISWGRGLIMASGTGLGGYYGAVGSQKVSSHALRIIVIVAGIGSAIYLGFRNY